MQNLIDCSGGVETEEHTIQLLGTLEECRGKPGKSRGS